jgi:hypothetical protein
VPRVDFDRGVILRLHASGARICAYADSPGAYFDINERPVDDTVAREAGFDVDKDRTEQRKREALAKARADIEREFQSKDGDYAKAMEAAILGPMEVKHVGAGRFALFDTQGKRVTEGRMSREQAEQLLVTASELTPSEPSEADAR